MAKSNGASGEDAAMRDLATPSPLPSLLPLTLTAALSVLLDFALPCSPATRIVERTYVQSAILLSLSFQHGTLSSDGALGWYGDATVICCYGTVFLTSLGTALTSATLTTGGGKEGWGRYGRHLGPSCLPPLVGGLFLSSAGDDDAPHDGLRTMVLLFAASFASLCLWDWRRSLRERRALAMAGMPLSDRGRDSSRASEGAWHDWTPSRFIDWLSTSSDDRLRNLVPSLAAERIDGASLPCLTLDDLRSFGIGYGDAVRLWDALGNLMDGRGDFAVSGAWDRGRDGRYRTWVEEDLLASRGWVDPPSGDEVTGGGLLEMTRRPASFAASEDERGTMDPAAAERARKVMQEKFGLSLPAFRTSGGAAAEPSEEGHSNFTDPSDGNYRPSASFPGSTDGAPGDAESSKTPPETQPVAATPPKSCKTAEPSTVIDESFLSAMPPDVREVASRRPDLVRALLARKRGSTNTGVPAPSADGPRRRNPVPSIDPEALEAMPPRVREIASRNPQLVTDLIAARRAQDKIGPTSAPKAADTGAPHYATSSLSDRRRCGATGTRIGPIEEGEEDPHGSCSSEDELSLDDNNCDETIGLLRWRRSS